MITQPPVWRWHSVSPTRNGTASQNGALLRPITATARTRASAGLPRGSITNCQEWTKPRTDLTNKRGFSGEQVNINNGGILESNGATVPSGIGLNVFNGGRVWVRNGSLTTAGQDAVFSTGVLSVGGVNSPGGIMDLGAGNPVTTSNSTAALLEGGEIIAETVTLDTGTQLRFGFSDNATGLIRAADSISIDAATFVLSDSGGNTFAANDTFLIADAGVAQSITERVVGTLGGFNLRLLDGTFGAIGGDATDTYLVLLAAALSGTRGANNQAVENILTDLLSTSDPVLAQIVSDLQGASSPDEYNDILESLLPSGQAADLVGALQVVGQTLDVTNNRLDSLTGADDLATQGAGMVMGDGINVWVQAFGEQ